MDEQFVVTGLDLRPQETNRHRQIARFEVRHIQVRDYDPEKAVSIDPIETSVTAEEAIKARDMLRQNMIGGLMLTLREADGYHRLRTTLESKDGKLILLVPPKALHR